MVFACIFVEISLANGAGDDINMMFLAQHLLLFLIRSILRVHSHLYMGAEGYRLGLPLREFLFRSLIFICFAMLQKLALFFSY